jgi:hypothetical protein
LVKYYTLVKIRDFQVKIGHGSREISPTLVGGSRCYRVKFAFDSAFAKIKRSGKFHGLLY